MAAFKVDVVASSSWNQKLPHRYRRLVWKKGEFSDVNCDDEYQLTIFEIQLFSKHAVLTKMKKLRNKFKCIFLCPFQILCWQLFQVCVNVFWPRGHLPCKSWPLRLELWRILLVKYVGSLLGGETPGNPGKKKRILIVPGEMIYIYGEKYHEKMSILKVLIFFMLS